MCFSRGCLTRGNAFPTYESAVFGADLINIHEWAGLRSNFVNRKSDFIQTLFDDISIR